MIATRPSSVRGLIDGILAYIEEHSSGVHLSVEVSGSIVKVTADLNGGSVPRSSKPTGRVPHVPACDPSEYVEKIRELMSDGKPRRLKDIAELLVGPRKPKTLVKPAVTALLDEGYLRTDVRGLRLASATSSKPGRPANGARRAGAIEARAAAIEAPARPARREVKKPVRPVKRDAKPANKRHASKMAALVAARAALARSRSKKPAKPVKKHASTPVTEERREMSAVDAAPPDAMIAEGNEPAAVSAD